MPPREGETFRDDTTTSRFASGADSTGPGNGGRGNVVTVIPVAPTASAAPTASFTPRDYAQHQPAIRGNEPPPNWRVMPETASIFLCPAVRTNTH